MRARLGHDMMIALSKQLVGGPTPGAITISKLNGNGCWVLPTMPWTTAGLVRPDFIDFTVSAKTASSVNGLAGYDDSYNEAIISRFNLVLTSHVHPGRRSPCQKSARFSCPSGGPRWTHPPLGTDLLRPLHASFPMQDQNMEKRVGRTAGFLSDLRHIRQYRICVNTHHIHVFSWEKKNAEWYGFM